MRRIKGWAWAGALLLVLAAAGSAVGQERFIRDDAGDTAHQSISAEGLPIFGLADAYGRLWVNIASGVGGVQTEDVAASGGEVGVYCLGVQQDVLADSASATGDFISFKMDALGALYVQGPFREDDGHTTLDYGLQVLGVRLTTRASLCGTTADYAPFQLTDTGDVRVRDDDANTDLDTIAGDTTAMAADMAQLVDTQAVKVPVWLAAKIIGTPGTPLVLAADTTYCTSVTFQAGRAAAANASMITIGGNTAYTSQRAKELAPGDDWSPQIPAGTKWDLNDFYIDGVDTDDGVRIMYVAP